MLYSVSDCSFYFFTSFTTDYLAVASTMEVHIGAQILFHLRIECDAGEARDAFVYVRL
jgi:hypothetical protein